MKAVTVMKRALAETKGLRIKLLGDSITHGVGGTGFEQNGEPITKGYARNPDGYCWAKRFKEYMKEKYGCTVINNGCTGTRIEFILERFEELVSPEDDLILCTIGTNNRHFYFKDGDKPSREALGKAFYENVLKLYQTFKDHGKSVIFMANLPAAASNEKDGKDYWRILHMDDINQIYKKAAEKAGFPLISMYDLFSDYCKENALTVSELLCDGLHPNDRGYDVMFELLKEELGL